jgi:hypothetical protein
MNRYNFAVFAALAATVLSVQATPRDLDDLLDIRARNGDRELEDRGYHHRKSIDGKNGSIEYWWSRREDQCIAVNVKDGRFSAITKQPEAICDSGGSSRRDHYDSDDDRDRRYDDRDDDLDDLKGMRTRRGEDELEDLGYRLRKTLDVKHGSIDYWWNRREDQCIAVNSKDGRFTAITEQPASVCER